MFSDNIYYYVFSGLDVQMWSRRAFIVILHALFDVGGRQWQSTAVVHHVTDSGGFVADENTVLKAT